MDYDNEWNETVWDSIFGELRRMFLGPSVFIVGIPMLSFLIMVPISLLLPIEWNSFREMPMLLFVAVLISVFMTAKIVRVTIHPDLLTVGRPAPFARLVRTITAVACMVIVRTFLKEKANEQVFEKRCSENPKYNAFAALDEFFIKMYLPWVLEIAFWINFARIVDDVLLIIIIVYNYILNLLLPFYHRMNDLVGEQGRNYVWARRA